jgi:hypothetical protein
VTDTRYHRFAARAWTTVLAACVIALASCSKDEKPTQPLPPDTQAPNFALQDVNPNSATAGQDVSPRSQLGNVSAWYFGHAT